jgi:hypothetical protein
VRVKYGKYTSGQSLGLSGRTSVQRFLEALDAYLRSVCSGLKGRRTIQVRFLRSSREPHPLSPSPVGSSCGTKDTLVGASSAA